MNKQEEEAWLEAHGFVLTESLGDYRRWERGWVSVVFGSNNRVQVQCFQGRYEMSSVSVLDGLQKLSARLRREMAETGDSLDAVEEAMRSGLSERR